MKITIRAAQNGFRPDPVERSTSNVSFAQAYPLPILRSDDSRAKFGYDCQGTITLGTRGRNFKELRGRTVL